MNYGELTVSELHEHARERALDVSPDAKKGELIKALERADRGPTVTVRFEGTNAPGGEISQLEHEQYVLPRGRDTEVPKDVADHLTSGENARLYRVVRVESEGKD